MWLVPMKKESLKKDRFKKKKKNQRLSTVSWRKFNEKSNYLKKKEKKHRMHSYLKQAQKNDS